MGIILGALSRGDMSADDLKDLVVRQYGISEKMYNVSKAILHKELTIDSYQDDKRFYWTTLVKGKKED